MEAQQRIMDTAERDRFFERFSRTQALWEFLWYHDALLSYKDNYGWLAKVFASVQPASASGELLWLRLGQKTLDLVHSRITDVTVTDGLLDEVVVDDAVIEVIKELKLPGIDGTRSPTAKEVLDSIDKRLKKKAEGNPASAWTTLAERLDRLRRTHIAKAEDSVDFLKELLELARMLLAAEQAEQDGTIEDWESALPNPHIGALTQIFDEYAPDTAPDIVERVVIDIDNIADQVRGTNWQTSQPTDRAVRIEIRKALNKYGLPAAGQLFNRAYAYIEANY